MDAILGSLVAILISLLGYGGLNHWAQIGADNIRSAAAASQMLIFDKASQQYIEDNAATIAAIATSAAPVTITTAQMVAANYLPSGFSGTNPFQQTYLLQVLQPSSGQLQGLVTTQGGTAIGSNRNYKQLVLIAAQMGAQGGFVPYAGQAGAGTSMTSANAYGAYGAWTVPLTGYTAPGSGHLASLLSFNASQNTSSSFLYRVAVPGQPQLNSMQTDLGMTDVGGTAHNIAGANQISSQSLQALANGSLSVPSIQLANGTVIAFNQVGEGGVLGLKGTNGQMVYLESQNGTFRMINSGWTGVLYTVDQSGNVVASGSLQPGNVGTPRTACTGTGIAGDSDGSGLMLSCQGGVWLPIGGTSLTYNTYQVTNGYVVPAPYCASGGRAEIVVDHQQITIDDNGTANVVISAGPLGQ